jgi:hypothetical protein
MAFYVQDDIEALCEIITIVGGTLAASPQAHTRNFLEGYLTRLEKLSKVCVCLRNRGI